jgi:V8-like Glu-specific endopeptidase
MSKGIEVSVVWRLAQKGQSFLGLKEVLSVFLLLSPIMSFSSVRISDHQQKVIYGEDNRYDVKNYPDEAFRLLSRSTAAMIPTYRMNVLEDGQNYSIRGDTLSSAMNVCAEEPFAQQITAANCSGFLVGPDVLVTAGHCIQSAFDCSNAYWVFDYNLGQNPGKKFLSDAVVGEDSASKTSTILNVNKESVYRCSKVIATKLDRMNQEDYAVIQLDRVVTSRAPLAIRKQGSVAAGDKLVVIGHPSGLPTKIADNASVRDNSRPAYFVANLDTFGGNSGSAVFNLTTKEVEGILVRGERDYVWNGSKNCEESHHCTDDGCRGEDVTRITVIPQLR